MFRKTRLLLLVLIGLAGNARAQVRAYTEKTFNEMPMLTLNANYGGQVPVGLLADRFGPGFTAGAQVEYLFWPGNWILGVDGQFGFAGKVREDVLDFLRDDDGNIIGRDLAISQAFLQQRIVSGRLTFGKLIPFSESNRRSGIRLCLGAGYQFHWIRVNDELNSLSQIEGDYGAGYDRLTGGWLVSEFIGYQHISLNRRINFYLGVDLSQAFGRSLRTYDFATMRTDDLSRVDQLVAFRAGWCIPLWTGLGTEDIYY